MDPNITYYWCRERVRGRKRMRQAEKLKETVEATGTSSNFSMSRLDPSHMNPSALGLANGRAVVEEKKSEAFVLESWYSQEFKIGGHSGTGFM